MRLDAPRMSVPQKVLNAFDIVAVVPETDDAFRAACASSDVDLISVACGARLPFAVARKDVEVAIKRGAAFEVSYAHAIAQPRSLRHLTATGLRLALTLTNGGRASCCRVAHRRRGACGVLYTRCWSARGDARGSQH